MVVLATDAPVSDRQLGRMARRVGHGLARTGSTAGHGSGDFVIAFANETTWPLAPESLTLRRTLLAEDGGTMGLLFQATIEATEEAVINALFAAQTVTGRDGHVRHALPLDLVLDVLARNNRLRRRLC
jgi:D-aminopeptidase